MPSWGMHIETANRLSQKINIEKNAFLFGNIMPDIKNGYILLNLKETLTHNETHFTQKEDIEVNHFTSNNIERFAKEYINEMDNPVVLGYFTHLLTDYFWNEYTYNNHYVRNENGEVIGVKIAEGEFLECNKKEARVYKHKDFRSFDYYLSNRKRMDIPKFDKKLLGYCSELNELKLNDEEIKTTVEYIEKMRQRRIEEKRVNEHKYVMFSKEELEFKLEESIEFIENYLKNINNYNTGKIKILI